MIDLLNRYKNIKDNTLTDRTQKSLIDIKNIIQEVFDTNKHNEQWFLNYLDSLNKLSTIW